MINIQQGMSPQLYMSMHGLNNLINNNVQLQRLDDINNIDNINNNVRHQQQRITSNSIIIIQHKHAYNNSSIYTSYNNSSIKVNHDKQG